MKLSVEQLEFTLTTEQLHEVILNALCNGMSTLSSSGIEIDFVNEADYEVAKASLKSKQAPNVAICFEDVYMEGLKLGLPMQGVDMEGDGDNTQEFSLAKAEVNLKLPDAKQFILNMVEENDDAIDADAILQFILYGEIIYG